MLSATTNYNSDVLLKVQTVSVIGRAWKRTHCDFCRTPYVYLNEQHGYGERLGMPVVNAPQLKAGASADAERILARNLDTRESLARCPVCGKFQVAMINSARQDREVRARRIGRALSVLPMFGLAIAAAAYPKNNNWLILSIPFALALGLAVTQLWVLAIRRFFDPNNGDWVPTKLR